MLKDLRLRCLILLESLELTGNPPSSWRHSAFEQRLSCTAGSKTATKCDEAQGSVRPMTMVVGPMTMAEGVYGHRALPRKHNRTTNALFPLLVRGYAGYHVPITCPMIAQPFSTVGSRHTVPKHIRAYNKYPSRNLTRTLPTAFTHHSSRPMRS